MIDCLEGIDAIPCYGYQVSYHNEPVQIAYPDNLITEKPSKKPEGRSFHHGKFISKLRAAAQAAPNVTVVESTVTDIVKNGYTGQVLGVECQTKGEKDYYFGAVTLVADGYASKFRKEHLQSSSTRSAHTRLESLLISLRACPVRASRLVV